MAILRIEQGPEAGRQYFLVENLTVLGRQADTDVCLPAKAVSRRHAQISKRDGKFFLEDLESSNGTFLNGERVNPGEFLPLTERDKLQLGPYVLSLFHEPTLTPTEDKLVIRDQTIAHSLHESVYAQAPAQKLQVILEITQNLARTLDQESLLEKLLDQLMRLFPQADRTMVLLLEEDNLVVRGQRCRGAEEPSVFPYSRTVVKEALEKGIGLLSEDVQDDTRFDSSMTLTSLNLHSLICVPLINQDGRRLGIIQVDRFHRGRPFSSQDLQLLTAICLQMAVALDNAELHVQLLREERLRQELALAREIQQGFLPTDFDDFHESGFEIFAQVHPARTVSGDLYDCYMRADGKLAFFIGDVSGKGMPAALFMVAVRTLCSHLAAAGDSPAATLTALNERLAQDNPAGMFVTIVQGLYDPATGEVVLASGGHPLPLLRMSDGQVKELKHRAGRMIGYEDLELRLSDCRCKLAAGDTLVFYTDGVTESREPENKAMFGVEGVKKLVQRFDTKLSLAACADLTRKTIQDYTQSSELKDDLTMLLLRRRPAGAPAPPAHSEDTSQIDQQPS